MSIRINFDPPKESDIQTIRISKSDNIRGVYLDIEDINARDEEGEYITFYDDPCGRMWNFYIISFIDTAGNCTESEPVRVCITTPVHFSISIPDERDTRVSVIFIYRSDCEEGIFELIDRIDAQDEAHSPVVEYTDFGGHADFCYKIAFGYSDEKDGKAVWIIGEESNVIQPVNISGNLIARVTERSLIAGDHQNTENLPFREYANCGYHQFSPIDVICGTKSSPYSRQLGLTSGNNCGDGGGLSLFERNIQRQLELLDVTGENIIIFRRKWTGERCPKLNTIDENPHTQCSTCFGTGYVGGYDRILFNKDSDNPQGKAKIRLQPAVEDVLLNRDAGLDVIAEYTAWTLPQPVIRDRDVIVQFDPIDTRQEVWRYEVLDVTRGKFFCGFDSVQFFRMKRLNKFNDIIYSVPLIGKFDVSIMDGDDKIILPFGEETDQVERRVASTIVINNKLPFKGDDGCCDPLSTAEVKEDAIIQSIQEKNEEAWLKLNCDLKVILKSDDKVNMFLSEFPSLCIVLQNTFMDQTALVVGASQVDSSGSLRNVDGLSGTKLDIGHRITGVFFDFASADSNVTLEISDGKRVIFRQVVSRQQNNFHMQGMFPPLNLDDGSTIFVKVYGRNIVQPTVVVHMIAQESIFSSSSLSGPMSESNMTPQQTHAIKQVKALLSINDIQSLRGGIDAILAKYFDKYSFYVHKKEEGIANISPGLVKKTIVIQDKPKANTVDILKGNSVHYYLALNAEIGISDKEYLIDEKNTFRVSDYSNLVYIMLMD